MRYTNNNSNDIRDTHMTEQTLSYIEEKYETHSGVALKYDRITHTAILLPWANMVEKTLLFS